MPYTLQYSKSNFKTSSKSVHQYVYVWWLCVGLLNLYLHACTLLCVVFYVFVFIPSLILKILSQIEIKLNWLPMPPFLVYTHGKCLTFGKPFVRKPYNVSVFFNRFCEKRGSVDRIMSGLLF